MPSKHSSTLDTSRDISYTLFWEIAMDILNPFLLCLIPLMVALDAPGVLPLYVAMTEGMKKNERKIIVRQSILTAFLITIGFVLIGRAIFTALGIMVEDFMIAGGIVLMIIAVLDIVRAGEKRINISPTLGVVPLGTPLIAGPATLTTTLVLVGSYGYAPVILSLVLNILLAWLIFSQADRIIKLIGINGSRAFAKVAALILAAIAVKMIRSGIVTIIGG
ncbi:MAG: MarC family protein [Nitrospirae bacterium]|nr:MarC family protein [Nitrospirota bacterium]